MPSMKQDSLKLFSTIKPTLMRSALFKGTFLAGVGVMILALCGALIPVSTMEIWGIPILLVGGGLITYGLIPYRKLCRIESVPSELILIDGKFLQLITLGKQVYSIPMVSIEKIDYLEQGDDYGITIQLKKDLREKIVVHDPSFNMSKQQQLSRDKYSCDLFIPYFGRRSFTRIAFLCS